MEAIITAATILATYLSMAAQDNSKFAYNARTNGGRVESIEVLKNENTYLSQSLQYRFLYDSADRLVSKEALKWNSLKREWEPARRYTYTYGDTGYTMQMSEWDAEKGEYAAACEQSNYYMVADKVMAVDTFRKNNASGKFELADNMLVMQPQQDMLLA